MSETGQPAPHRRRYDRPAGPSALRPLFDRMEGSRRLLEMKEFNARANCFVKIATAEQNTSERFRPPLQFGKLEFGGFSCTRAAHISRIKVDNRGMGLEGMQAFARWRLDGERTAIFPAHRHGSISPEANRNPGEGLQNGRLARWLLSPIICKAAARCSFVLRGPGPGRDSACLQIDEVPSPLTRSLLRTLAGTARGVAAEQCRALCRTTLHAREMRGSYCK